MFLLFILYVFIPYKFASILIIDKFLSINNVSFSTLRIYILLLYKYDIILPYSSVIVSLFLYIKFLNDTLLFFFEFTVIYLLVSYGIILYNILVLKNF